MNESPLPFGMSVLSYNLYLVFISFPLVFLQQNYYLRHRSPLDFESPTKIG